MKKLVVLLLASLVATSAFAIIDPDDNSIGIYFDTNGDNICALPPAGVPFEIYLVATNPTSGVLGGYELGFEWVNPTGGVGTFYMLGNTSAATGVDVGVRDAVNGIGDYIMGWATPIAATPATVLHTWTYMQLGADFPMEFFLRQATVTSIEGATYPILLGDANALVPCGQSTGGPDIPVAVAHPVVFNEDTQTWDRVACDVGAPVGVEEASFGSVKSLFR